LRREDVNSLFDSNSILSETELEARHEVWLEQYHMAIQIESRVLGDLARNHIIPTAITYQNRLLENVKGLKEVLDTKTFKAASAEQCNLIEEISERIGIINNTITEMIEARKAANAIEDSRELAIAYDEKVKPYFDTIRYHVDKLEIIIDDELWPLPKYREMLFTR